MAVIDEDARKLEFAIRSAIDDARRPIHELEVASFEAVAAVFGKEERVRHLKSTREALLSGSWYEKAPAELRRLLALSSTLLQEASELRDTDAPEAVKRFLDNARRAGATFADLTPDVRRWLEDKRLLGQLRITLGAR
jgi:hypothetical protein